VVLLAAVALVGVVAVVLLLGGGEERPERIPANLPEYEGAPGLRPSEVVEAYVEAVDAHDGKRFCELVAPYISGRYDAVLRDPDDRLPGVDGCIDYVGSYIGRVEDCHPRVFSGARLVAIDGIQPRGELRLARARIRVRWKDTCAPRDRSSAKTLREHVWLARFDGAWRVAKLGKLPDAASLVMARRPEEGPSPGDARPEAPPDVEAEQHAFATWVGSLERRLAEREADFRPVGNPETCSGGMSLRDPRDDQMLNGVAAGRRGDAPRLPRSDLQGMDVAAETGRVCVRWVMAGKIAPPVELTYQQADPASGYVASFVVELRGDGTARVSAARDAHGDPIALPAAVGAGGRAVSIVLDRESFERSRPTETPHTPPQLESFTVKGYVTVPLTGAKSVYDALGRSYGSTYSYPSGRRCQAAC
jgi:hypothetical protein